MTQRITTQGIRYTGSKKDIIPRILELVDGRGIRRTLDACAGSTRVSQAFKQAGYDVDANDLALYSTMFGRPHRSRPV